MSLLEYDWNSVILAWMPSIVAALFFKEEVTFGLFMTALLLTVVIIGIQESNES